MTLFKIEDVIAEARPGLTHTDIMKMPFYEFMLKLDIMKERAEESEKKQKSDQGEYSMDKMKQSSGFNKSLAPPKMPKLPSNLKF